MNRLIYSLLLFFLCAPLVAQEGLDKQDLSRATYVVDERCEIDFLGLVDEDLWDISNLERDNEIDLGSTGGRDVSIPYYGLVSKNNAGSIYQIRIGDPLMKYGTRKVILDQPMTVLSPELETKNTGYTITLAPEDIDEGVLYQLPIRPDSIRITISATITDTDWEDVSVRHKSPYLENRSFERMLELDRKVAIKIAPFGWTPVNSVAPMIDWDKNFVVKQRFFIAPNLDVPYSILEERSGVYSLAILDFKKSNVGTNRPTGSPQIKAIPNPVISDVRFEISNVPEGSYIIKIKNILGEIKVQKKIQYISTDIIPLNIDGLSKGSYFYVLEDDQGNTLSTKRLIVLKP